MLIYQRKLCPDCYNEKKCLALKIKTCLEKIVCVPVHIGWMTYIMSPYTEVCIHVSGYIMRTCPCLCSSER